MAGDNLVKQFSFSRGIIARNQNPLGYPMDALIDGLNVDLVNESIRTRRGYYLTSSGSLASNGVVNALFQIRFPSTQKSFLVAQVDTGTNNKLYISDTALPVIDGSLTFSELYDLGAGADVISWAVLNDRIVMTEGNNNNPLVWAGSTTDTVAEWAIPKQVLFSRGTFAAAMDTNTIYWHDITEWVCDTDNNSVAWVGASAKACIAMCFDTPRISKISIDIGTPNTTSTATVKFFEMVSGAWAEGTAHWTDGTGELAQDGILTYTGGDYIQLEHATIGNVSGYWLVMMIGASDASLVSSEATINRIQFKAPCQPLANIGDGLPDICSAFLYARGTIAVCNYSVDVADYTNTSYGELNNGDLSSPVGMGTSDYIYVAHPDRFTALDIILAPNQVNTNTATLTAQYWGYQGWTALTIIDRTASGGKTLALNGRIGWNVPADWERCAPNISDSNIAYWVRFKVNASLSGSVGIAEARVLPVTSAVRRHKYCFRYRDRIVLVGDTAASDQIAISRAFEEYGFSGPDSMAMRIGGADPIIAACELYNQGWLFRAQDLYMLNGYDPATFSMERAEIANQIPVNNRVLVKAPMLESDDKAKMGFYFLSHTGVHHFTGLQLYKLSDNLPYFDEKDGAPYLDHANLHKAVGCYWPERNWAVWSVPMCLIAGEAQTTNNRLMIFDLTLRAWLPLQAISVASLCVAFDNVSAAVGGVGRPGLYGGTYDGKIIKLFDEKVTHDAGVDITTMWKTGWLDFGQPSLKKKIYKITLFAQTSSPVIMAKVYKDGNQTQYETHEFTRVGDVGTTHVFTKDYTRYGLEGDLFQFEWSMSEDGIVYGTEYELATRGWDEGDQ